MYKIAYLIFSIFIALQVSAQQAEQTVHANITHVTVFSNQAQVTRNTKLNLQAGITQVVFERISPYIIMNSIQVKTSSNVQLMSVSQRNNFLLEENKPPVMLEIEDTLGKINDQLEVVSIRLNALLIEKQVLEANKQIGGTNSGVNIEDLEEALNLFRKRSNEIGEEIMKLNKQKTRLNIIRDRFQNQLNTYIQNRTNSKEIVLLLKALTAANNVSIECSYLVSQAGWSPFYDIRVKDIHTPLQLVTKAHITQSTREEWNNVRLKLSTANPSESGVKPQLIPQFLYFNDAIIHTSMVAGDAPERKAKAAAPETESNASYPQQGIGEEVQTDMSVEYSVTSAYSIPSDGNPHQVDLMINEIPASYRYTVIPKLDKNAFVLARIANKDLGSLISAEAHVYFEGTYIGKTLINQSTDDTLDISLGRDKRIQIQRVLIKEFSSTTISGSNKKEIYTWEISLRNTTKQPVYITTEDQIPVSKNKEIEVKLVQQGGATWNEATGNLQWNTLLEPDKLLMYRFTYELKYPKEKILNPH